VRKVVGERWRPEGVLEGREGSCGCINRLHSKKKEKVIHERRVCSGVVIVNVYGEVSHHGKDIDKPRGKPPNLNE
jgi:hypothetical protein